MRLGIPVVCVLMPLALTACGSAPRLDEGSLTEREIECVPYARQVSGIQLYGDAATWWDQAAGRYSRASEPSPGAVLVFRRSPRLPHGHVSVVSALRSQREITVTQANWVHGRVAVSEPVVDVSPGNDWTVVRVWWQPSHALGATAYPTYGFVSARRAGGSDVLAAR